MRIGGVSGPRVTLRAPVPLAEPLVGFSPGRPDQLLDAERHPLHLGGQHRRIHQIGELNRQPPNFPGITGGGQEVLGLGITPIDLQHLPR